MREQDVQKVCQKLLPTESDRCKRSVCPSQFLAPLHPPPPIAQCSTGVCVCVCVCGVCITENVECCTNDLPIIYIA